MGPALNYQRVREMLGPERAGHKKVDLRLPKLFHCSSLGPSWAIGLGRDGDVQGKRTALGLSASVLGYGKGDVVAWQDGRGKRADTVHGVQGFTLGTKAGRRCIMHKIMPVF